MTLPATQPTARPRGAARREALLDATLRLVAESGADAVTHRRVAELAGLPLASTTYWFDSKEHLLTAALGRAAELDLKRLADAARLLGGRPVTPRDVVAVIVPDAEPSAGRAQLLAVYTLLLEAARRPALQELSRRWTEAYLLTVGDLCARAGSRRPRADAQLIIGAADGLAIDSLSTGSAADSDQRAELERLASTLLRGER